MEQASAIRHRHGFGSAGRPNLLKIACIWLSTVTSLMDITAPTRLFGFAGVVAGCIVIVLKDAAMPVLAKFARNWLRPQPPQSIKIK